MKLTLADAASRQMAKKWIQKVVKHPGVEKEKARHNGVSTHEQLEKDSHSTNSSVRGRGNLGLRFEKHGDLHKKPNRAAPARVKHPGRSAMYPNTKA